MYGLRQLIQAQSRCLTRAFNTFADIHVARIPPSASKVHPRKGLTFQVKLGKFADMANREPKEVIRLAGGTTEVARYFGISHEAVRQWGESGIPPKRAGRVARLTGLSLHEVCPDIFADGSGASGNAA
jgi:hypothetical protein